MARGLQVLYFLVSIQYGRNTDKQLFTFAMHEETIPRVIHNIYDQLIAQMRNLISTTVHGLNRKNEDQAQEQLKEIKKPKYVETLVFKLVRYSFSYN